LRRNPRSIDKKCKEKNLKTLRRNALKKKKRNVERKCQKEAPR